MGQEHVTRQAITFFYRRLTAAVRLALSSVLLMCVTAAFAAGLALWWVAIHRSHEGRREMLLTVLEHGASALIVAAFMGVTYEYLLRRAVRREEHEWAVDAISEVAPLMPAAVFALVKDLATRSPQ